MDEYQVPTLQQAATSPNVSGALQQLLLSRTTSPEQVQAMRGNRKEQLGQYQEALRGDPSPGYSALDHSLYSWIGNIGKSHHPAINAMQGIAAGGKFMGDQATKRHAGNVTAAGLGYEDAKYDETQADKELIALRGTLGRGGAGAVGKIVTAKDDAGNLYFTNNVTGAQQVIPASKAKFWESAQKQGFEKATAEKHPDPEGYSVEFANAMVARSPGGVTTQDTLQKPTTPVGQPSVPAMPDMPAPTPGIDDRQFVLLQEYQDEKKRVTDASSDPTSEAYNKALRNMQLIRQELKDIYKIDPLKPPQAAQPVAPGQPTPPPTPMGQPPVAAATPTMQPSAPPPGTPGVNMPPQVAVKPPIPGLQYQDKPAAALAEKEAAKIGEARGAEYQAVQQAAAAAETQLQAFNTLDKIKPNTNAAANAQEHIAGLFNALGADPNSPMLLNAIKNRESNQILDQLRNASLKAENGVQTKSDEDRIGREFPKTTDFSKAWEFGLKLGKERALRAQDRLAYYDSKVDGSSNIGKGRSNWNAEMAGDPITQYLGGKLMFRSDFIQKYMQKYPEDGKAGAVAEWRAMEKDYQARGGRK